MRLVLLAIPLILSGCFLQGNLERLRDIEPEADNFASALAAEYLAYAQSESEQGRAASAHYFAGKGLDAYDGESVAPESAGKGMENARRLLLELLTDDMKHVSPQNLARAQMLFDCWAVQAKQPGQEIAPCQDEFQATVSELQPIAELFVIGKDSVHTLEFEPYLAAIDEIQQKKIEQVAKLVSRLKHYTVEIEAFPHRKRKEAIRLSEARLSAVQNALVANSVSMVNIKVVNPSDGKAVYFNRELADAVKVTIKTLGQGTQP